MNMEDFFTPGIMLSQVWPRSREMEGETLSALNTVLEYGFYKAFQSVEIQYSAERKAVARVIKDAEVTLTYCLARVLNENKLNLSDLDGVIRKKSCKRVIECLEEAYESGWNQRTMIAGPHRTSKSKVHKDYEFLLEDNQLENPYARQYIK